MSEFNNDLEKKSYGALRFSSINIGDEIQSLAAMRFLPHIDYYIERERTDKFRSADGEKVKLIMNAWWLWEADHFPPSDDIDPLFVSFHLREAIRGKFMTYKTVEYLKKHGPIGCRDTGTVKCLQSNGIDAYFTGCLTTTLMPNFNLKNKFGAGYILCVDVPDNLFSIIKKRTDKPIYNITRMISPVFTSLDRFKAARFILLLYHNASCVITPRLHVGLPSLAFHTPVCMIESEKLPRHDRFGGLERLFNSVNMEAYSVNPYLYDINDPPENPGTYKEISEPLIEKCTQFTGYDCCAPLWDDGYNPIIEMFELMKYDKEVLKRFATFAEMRDITNTMNDIYYKKKSRYDLTY